MRIYDISMEIFHDMPVYKGKSIKRPIIKTDCDFSMGKTCESRLTMNLHTGTHIDSPLHVIEDGKTLDNLNIKRVVTRCKVLDFTYVEEYISHDNFLDKDIAQGDFILLKTKNSYFDILEKDFIYLNESGAQYLMDKHISGVGIDALGIERNQSGHPTHKILLNSDIVILEGLRLKDVEEGEYFIIAAPIKIRKAEAAPVRAILIEDLSLYK